MFWLNGPQGLITASATTALDIVSTHIAKLCAKMRAEGRTLVEPNKEFEDRYCEMIYNGSTAGRAFFAQCTPGYYNNEGEVDLNQKTLFAPYPDRAKYNGGVNLHRMMEQQQAEGTVFDGFDLQ